MKTEKTISAKENNSHPVKSAVLTAVVSAIMACGFILMTATALRFEFAVRNVIIWSVIVPAVYTVLYYLNRKYVTIAALISGPVLLGTAIALDIWKIRTGLLEFIEYYRLNVFLWMPGDSAAGAEDSSRMFAFLLAFSLLPICYTTYSLMRRRLILLSLVLYLPFFVCSVTNVGLAPDQIPVIVAFTGTFIAVMMHVLRRKRRDMAEKVILVSAVPVILFGALMGLMYPQDKYDKNELAQDILTTAKDKFDEAAEDKDSLLSRFIDMAQNGWFRLSNTGSSGQFASLYATTTDLNNVGPFNPPDYELMTVLKKDNPDLTREEYVSLIMNDGEEGFYYSDHTLYLKVESLDTYEDNQLSASKIDMSVYPRSFVAPEGVHKSKYTISVTPLKPSSVDITPYYTDWYTAGDLSKTCVNPYNTTTYRDLVYASSPVPVKTGNIYSPEYLEDYVYDTALKVPEETERKLILSGALPSWYLDIYYGRSSMSDADKVRRVTEYVSALHPYDKDTDYPPRNADFVPWFVSDAPSGICIHYAATTMILLRMIGVPARYVRGYVDTGSFVDRESTVYSSQAHAWFEFFIPEYGWVMGDSTPGYAPDASSYNIEAISKNDPSIEKASFAVERTPVVAAVESYYDRNATNRSSDRTRITPTPGASTPTPTPTSTPTPTPKPNTNRAVVRLDNAYTEPIIFRLKILAVCIAAILLLAGIVKITFSLYWHKRFSVKDINARAIAYYRFYCFTAKFVGASPFAEVTKIAQKAAFSEEKLSQEEFNELLKLCRRYTFEISETLGGLKWILYKLTTIKIKERPSDLV